MDKTLDKHQKTLQTCDKVAQLYEDKFMNLNVNNTQSKADETENIHTIVIPKTKYTTLKD